MSSLRTSSLAERLRAWPFEAAPRLVNVRLLSRLIARASFSRVCANLAPFVLLGLAVPAYAQYESLNPRNWFPLQTTGAMGKSPILDLQECPFPDSATVVDTLDPLGYYPLAIGWIWEYVAVSGPFYETARRLSVIGDTTVNDMVFSIVDETTFSFPNPVKREITPVLRAKRYVSATDSTLVHLNPQDGQVTVDPQPFNASFNTCTESGTEISGGYGDTFVTVEHELDVEHEAAATKRFDSGPVGAITYAHGIGMVHGSFEISAEVNLAYVRTREGDELGLPLDQQFVITSVLGPELPSETSLSVYPNPTRGRVFVDVQTERPTAFALVVTDVLGREIDRIRTVSPSGGKRLEYSMHGRPAGLYVLTVLPDNGPPRFTTIVLLP